MKTKFHFLPLVHSIFIFASFSLLFSCSSKQGNSTSSEEAEINKDHQLTINHAKRFDVEYKDGYKLVTIKDPWTGADVRFYYALVSHDTDASTFPDSVKVVKVPVNRVVATSTTHLPGFEYLGSIDKLIGFPNTPYISSEAIRAEVDNGKIIELGSEAGMNMESLIAATPDLVMDYAMGNEFDKYKLVENIGIPVVLNADYMEESPLGRAEWIKFLALFINKEKEADSIFKSIETKYLDLQALVENADASSTVFSGIVYGDIWYMPGGNNFGAKFLNDAKGNYLWSDNPASGFIQLSFEAVYDQAHEADFWIGLGGMRSLEEIRNLDARYANFDAFKSGNVFNYNARMGEMGGNEFLELGYLRPDIILADLIKILHPELLPDYSLYFYQKLE